MKKILITGAGSYIGTRFEKYITENFSADYVVDTVDMLGDKWREFDFAGYDSVFHVAGIAHSDNGKISKEKEKLYRSINTDLTIETAKRAKEAGVKQFIFMSSAIVYGASAPIGKNKTIRKDTPVCPANCYGDSKLKAEEVLLALQSGDFKVCILRPPMIYGKGCKGNYPTLAKIALKIPVLPYVENERSMLYVGNLVEFVRLMVKNCESGIFFPQNSEYSNTTELIKTIAKAHGKKVHTLRGFDWLLRFLGLFTSLVNKAYGNFTYEKSMSDYDENYRIFTLEESILETES